MDSILIIATVLAFFVKGLSGFANTLVFSSILSFHMDNKLISPIGLVLGIPANIYFTWRERKNISARIVVPLSLLILTGMVPGALLLGNSDQRFIKLIFGVVVILFGADAIFQQLWSKKSKPNPVFLILIGLFSGVACGLFSVGASLAAYINRTTDNQSQFKGNICFVFLIENIARIFLYFWAGILTTDIGLKAIILFPFMFLGLMLGVVSSKFVNEQTAKIVVAVLLLVSGIVLMVTNL